MILMIGLLPSHAFALEADDPEVEDFLESIDWEAEEYEDYLAEFDLELANFDDVSELGTPATEEELEEVLEMYDMTYEELDELFREEDLLLEDEEISDSVAFIFTENVELFIDLILTDLGEAEDSFGSFEEEITDENLEELASAYGFDSIEELEELFNAYEDSINNYTTLFDVELAADFYVAEEGSESSDDLWEEDDDLWEDDDSWEEDDMWNDNAENFTADMFNTSFLTGEPVVDIYGMISVIFVEAAFGLQ